MASRALIMKKDHTNGVNRTKNGATTAASVRHKCYSFTIIVYNLKKLREPVKIVYTYPHATASQVLELYTWKHGTLHNVFPTVRKKGGDVFFLFVIVLFMDKTAALLKVAPKECQRDTLVTDHEMAPGMEPTFFSVYLTLSDSKIYLRVKGHAPGCDHPVDAGLFFKSFFLCFCGLFSKKVHKTYQKIIFK